MTFKDTGRAMKILVLTNHLSAFGGSEIVAVEVADVFSRIGCDVSIYSAYINNPIRSYMDEVGLKYGAIEECPNPETFDIIWSQHHLLPYLLAKYGTESVRSVFLVNASLSPYEPLEIPGAIAEVADIIVANSPETAERLTGLGISGDKVLVFYNSAPEIFDITRESAPELRRALIISNHMPDEVAGAATILRERGLTVDHIGLPFQQKRITPEIITSYDSVIAIGKSVQYSILCETPIYIYDRFGGPGWLNEANFLEAEEYNFSGRCCRRQILPQEIANELLYGYPEATLSIRAVKRAHSEKYHLQKYLLQVIERASNKIDNEYIRHIKRSVSNIIYREGSMCYKLMALYNTTQNQSSDIARLVSRMGKLSSEVEYLSQQISEMESAREDTIRFHQEVCVLKEKEIIDKNANIGQLEEKLLEIENSRSWKITKPLREINKILSRKKTK
ncbi:hypothetical protein [Brucella sp. NBRC 12950]|uniref:hypothetical protein n=1 Tax=Brucella sp. NBRC 12950 TaxID=2994518 RepID=UPI0024A42E33|nr:hypothetical protein [Brucella sp. NBRC 12950]GLU26087.1 hypothetical protein Brsp01_13200 [Brucella sp. NBRC 12950]